MGREGGRQVVREEGREEGEDESDLMRSNYATLVRAHLSGTSSLLMVGLPTSSLYRWNSLSSCGERPVVVVKGLMVNVLQVVVVIRGLIR